MTTDPINQTSAPGVGPVENAHIEPVTRKAPSANQQSEQTPRPPSDSVEISTPAHVRLLRQQGLSVGEIAFKLQLNLETVSRYLDSDNA